MKDDPIRFNFELSALTRLVIVLRRPVSCLNEFVTLPEAVRLIETRHLISLSTMFKLKPLHIMKIEVRWLELYLTENGILFFDFLKFIHRR